MTTDTSVVYLDSTMSGAPALSNTAGSLITLLDAGLVNGFGSITLDSLVIVDNVATGTISTGHNLAMVGDTGPVILIEGASAPAAINGRFRIQTIPNATTFTFITSGISNQTATGTITAKRASAGWEKAFSGTNKAAYRTLDVAGTQLLLRVDDTTTTYARVRGYEAMSDVDTGTGPFPTDAQFSGGGYMYKASSGSPVPWALYADSRMFYFFCDANGSDRWMGNFPFGDIASYAASDAYCTFLSYGYSATQTSYLYNLGTAQYAVLARSYTQLGGSIPSARYSHGRVSTLANAAQAYPSPVFNGILLWPVEVWENGDTARGLLPGLWNPVHDDVDLAQGALISNIPQLPGRDLLIQILATGYRCAMDITGPWR